MDRVQTPPPPYEVAQSLPGSTVAESSEDVALSGANDAADNQMAKYSAKGQAELKSSVEVNSERPCRQQRDGESSRKTPMSLIQNATQSFKDKRRAKEAARKVDYYEKLYGFVPKNAMTEAEWRDARERAPKTKRPFKGKSSGSLSVAALGGIAGGC